MVLDIAGPVVLQKSAPNSAKHFLYVAFQAVEHRAYWRPTYPGKKPNAKKSTLIDKTHLGALQHFVKRDLQKKSLESFFKEIFDMSSRSIGFLT